MVNGKFAEGVAILAKYIDPEKYDVRAEHDQIWIGDKITMSREDASRMRSLGWFKADEGGWSCFT